MNVLIVCPYEYHRPGGVQCHIRDLARSLRAAGHGAVVLAPGSGGGARPAADDAAKDGSEVVHIGRCREIGFNRTRFELSLATGSERRRLRDLLAPGRFDVVHYHTIWNPFLPLQALRVSHGANVATFHDTPPETWSGRLTRALFRSVSGPLLERLDAAIAVSPSPAGHLVRRGGRPLHILPPCVDLGPYGERVEPLPGLRDGRLNILFLGRLEPRKGVFTLLDAYARLARENLPVRLLVAGAGPQRAQLEERVRGACIPHVELLGPVTDARKAAVYASCDVFCAPSPYGESFGIVLAEAMASGRPVVAAANSGYRTVLRGAGASMLFRPGDAQDLYLRLRALAQDAGLRARLGAWGLEAARAYDCAAVVPRIVEVYRSALAFER